jgi:uncharacterized membrane protein
MLGHVQRRPGPDAPASEHLRWCRDVLLAFAGFGLVLGLPGLIAGSGGGKLLAVAAGACLVFAAQFWVLAAYFERRKPTARVRQAMTTAQSERQRLVSDWMFSVCMLPIPTAAAVVIDGVSVLVPMASMLGWAMAAGRVVIYRYMPESITMREQDRTQLTRLLKLAAILLGVGVVAAIAIAIGGGPASVALWPALALGVLCGIVSLVQVARATARYRSTGHV